MRASRLVESPLLLLLLSSSFREKTIPVSSVDVEKSTHSSSHCIAKLNVPPRLVPPSPSLPLAVGFEPALLVRFAPDTPFSGSINLSAGVPHGIRRQQRRHVTRLSRHGPAVGDVRRRQRQPLRHRAARRDAAAAAAAGAGGLERPSRENPPARALAHHLLLLSTFFFLFFSSLSASLYPVFARYSL